MFIFSTMEQDIKENNSLNNSMTFASEEKSILQRFNLEHSRYNSLFSVHFDLVRAPDVKERKKERFHLNSFVNS